MSTAAAGLGQRRRVVLPPACDGRHGHRHRPPGEAPVQASIRILPRGPAPWPRRGTRVTAVPWPWALELARDSLEYGGQPGVMAVRHGQRMIMLAVDK